MGFNTRTPTFWSNFMNGAEKIYWVGSRCLNKIKKQMPSLTESSKTTPMTTSKQQQAPVKSTPFIMLFVPQLDWFQDLLNQTTTKGEKSLSSVLIDLIIENMKKRKMLSPDEIEATESREEKKSKPSRGGIHEKFSLYIPKNLQFLKAKIKKAAAEDYSMSIYVWDLFVASQKLSARKEQQWKIYSSTQQRGRKRTE
jgi:hypothetical protein